MTSPGKVFPGKGNGKCKGPKAGQVWSVQRTERNMVWLEQSYKDRKIDEVREVVGPDLVGP